MATNDANLDAVRTEHLDLRSRPGGDVQFLHVHVHGKETTYLHVDVARKEWFSSKKVPKRQGKKATFDQIVSTVTGHSDMALVAGWFTYPVTEMPPSGILGQIGVSSEMAGVTVKLTGAQISVSGTPFDELRWNMWGKTQEFVDIYLSGVMKITISDSYLVEACDFLSSGLRTLGYGEKT